jgi:uncharacterized membrane protein
MLALTNRNNTIAVTQQLLKGLSVPFTNHKVKEAIEQNPDYPSIAAIHDVLKEYHIENMVLQVEKGKLDEVPVPFIAHMRGKTNGFLNIVTVTSEEVAYTKTNALTKRESITRKQFEQDWSGVALLAEATAEAGEKEYKINFKKEKQLQWYYPLLFAGLLFVFAVSVFSGTGNYTIPAFTVLALKLAGVVVTGMLLWYEIDKNNPFLQKVCSGSKATNCNAILQSKQAKLFGLINWSEIGFFYFAGGLFYVISTQEKSLELLAWLNLGALPYTVFSIYYQWRVAKQWCPLCLAVQALLIAEAITFFSFNLHQPLFNSQISFNAITVAFLLPVISWYFLKPLLLKAKEGGEYKNRFFRMKKDPRIFEALLAKQKKVTVSAEGLGITLGNPNAKNSIIKVCNPYCGPCSKAHPEIHELLHANDDLKVQILFTATAEEKDRRSKPVKHLLAVAEKQNEHLTEEALDDWYLPDNKDYDVFAAKYPMNGELKKQDAKLNAMNKWCDEVKIEFTPTFFVNGHQLPENYNINELKYFFSVHSKETDKTEEAQSSPLGGVRGG